MNRRRIQLLSMTGALLLGASCRGGSMMAGEGLPFYGDPDLTPVWSEPAHRIGSFQLTNQKGRTISDADLGGKIHIASFIFTSCQGICPPVVDHLLDLQETFRDDDRVLLLSFSVAPQVDDVEALDRFASHRGITEDKWHLLTGEPDTVYRLARESYFADEDLGQKGDDDFLHTETVLLVDEKLRIRGVYNGTMALDMIKLIEDVHRLTDRS